MRKMSDQENAFVKRRLREHLPRQPNTYMGDLARGNNSDCAETSLCPVCQRHMVSKFEVLGFWQGPFYPSAKEYCEKYTPMLVPLVLVSCPGCGSTLSFSAVTLGICDAETGCLVDGWDAEL